MAARGPFSIEAWIKPKTSYTSCATCGFVLPVARSAGSWQLGWAGTAPARGRDPLWVHSGISGPPIGANGWTFTIYAGYDCHGTPTCNPDNNHYNTAHRLQTTAPVEAGRWYHLAATYDGLTMRLYVDGALAGELNVNGIDDVRSSSNGLFGLGYASDEEHSTNTGVNPNCGCVMLQGQEDEAAYYGYALTAEQIADHYAAATQDPLSDPAGVASAYRTGVEADSPYLWFPLDEHYVEGTSRATCYPCPSSERTTGASAGGVGVPVRDITGPAFPLGKDDRGLEFRDGARIATTQGPKYPLPSTTTNMSIETWIQTAPTTPAKQAFYATPTCSGCAGMIGLRLNDGSIEVRADSDGFPSNTWQSLGGQGLNDGNWHHLLVVRDLTGTATWRAYVDGKGTGVTRPTSSTSLLRGKYLGLGDMNGWVDITGNGRIALDEFAYYTRALQGSRADYDFLIQRHAPVLLYDSQEEFSSLSPGAMTDFFDATSLLLDDSNSIKISTGARFAIADPRYVDPNPPGGLSRLNLSFLGDTYGDPPTNGWNDGMAASAEDFISVRGSADDDLYDDDARQMATQDPGQYADKTYARIRYGADGRVWIQYWLFYYFNSLAPVHEGDWEMVQVGLDPATLGPELAAYSQHTGGERCPWASVEKTADQPHVYVGSGSHASYFGAIPLVADGLGGPPVSPSAEEISDDTPSWAGWIGKWGESDTSPAGPAHGGNADKRDPGAWAGALTDVCS